MTVFGETVSDLRLGHYSISGTLSPDFRNHVVQARLLSPGDGPVVHRVDGDGTYRFDASKVTTWFRIRRPTKAEPSTCASSAPRSRDFNPTYERGLAIPVIDAESNEPIESATCQINEGPWAGDSLRQYKRERLRFPAALIHTDMTCTSAGFEPADVRWHGGPMSLELKRSGAG